MAAIFIVFKKAFDTVGQSLLLRKMFHYGFGNEALRLMSNYFDNRSSGFYTWTTVVFDLH
jgi:hypothetical protein